MAKLLQQGTRVAIFGDSHMEALGPRLRQLLPQQLGVQLTNVTARRGWSVPGYLRAGDVPQLVRGAEVVIVELGGNDAALQRGPQQHGSEVVQLLRQIGDKKVIWVGPGVTRRADLEAYRGPIRGAQRQAVERAGGVWIDSQPLTRPQDLRSDQVHFSAAGYDHWARQLLPKLAKAGEGRADASFPTWWIGPAAVGVGVLFAFGAYEWSRRA